MTRGDSPSRQKRVSKSDRSARLRRNLGSVSGQVALLLLWGMILFGLRDPALLMEEVQKSLTLCIRQVIPVLFPIAAAGGLLTVLTPPPPVICRPIGRLFRLSDASVGVLLISLVSGFPIGAMLASRLLEARTIGSEEASRLASYTNNASAAFLVGCAGRQFFGSARLGWILWASSILAALTVAAVMAKNAPLPSPAAKGEPKLPSPSAMANSLKATAQGMLNLTAFVVFFAVFCAFLEDSLALLLPAGDLALFFRAGAAALFEITGGLAAIARLPLSVPLRMGLAGAASGWGGLSVFFQCMAAGKAVRGKRLLFARLTIGALAGVFSFVLTALLS